MDLGVMMPVIFVITFFWATSMPYALFLDDLFHDITSSMLLEREDDWIVLLRTSLVLQVALEGLVINC
jgi:hypothetical protein